MPKSKRLSAILKTTTCLIALGVAVAACSPRVHTRGNLPDPELVAELKPGDITRDEVAELLGSPSSTAVFGGEIWLYISERTETLAWFEPEVMERSILVVSFDHEGILKEVETVGLDAANNVVPIDRTTPTHGSKLTFLEQMVGNLQRFGKRQ